MKENKKSKILIALDYDRSSRKVAETGYAFAKDMGAEILLLHIIGEVDYYSALDYSPIPGFMGFSPIDAAVIFEPDGIKKAMYNFLEKAKIHLNDNSIKTLIKGGDLAESILSAAKEQQADIIVIGSHSRKWLENILIGSVAEKVLRLTKIPVFIVPIKNN